MRNTTIRPENFVWAKEEFGHAELGDKRLVHRLVLLSARVAQSPAGTVTGAIRDAAESQGAYDFLANERFSHEPIAEAMFEATLKRLGLEPEPFVWVPIDGSSLKFTDKAKRKGLGSIGTRKSGALGLKTMSASAVSPTQGVVGLLSLRLWKRPLRRAKKPLAKRKVKQKETQHWLETMRAVRGRLQRHAPWCEPWFLLDREGDAWPTLLEGLEPAGGLFTVRAAWNRRLARGPGKYLWEALQNSPILGSYHLEVPRGAKRAARTARMELRACPLTLDLRDKWSKKHFEAPLYAVWTHERGTTPAGEKPLEWMLLTNFAVSSLDDAFLVVLGYAQRWRAEEFHHAWKSGACNAEATQLRSQERILKWVVLLAAVAMRIQRIKTLSRTQPHLPEIGRAHV